VRHVRAWRSPARRVQPEHDGAAIESLACFWQRSVASAAAGTFGREDPSKAPLRR
jgi:hypothetical protein